MVDREVGRRGALLLLALSFVPYLLPAEQQPSWYHDGKSPEELRRSAHIRQLNRYLGGDITQVFRVSDDEP